MILVNEFENNIGVWYSSLDSFNPYKVIVIKPNTASDLWAVQVVETGLVKYVDNEFLFLTEDEAEICSTLLMRKFLIKRNVLDQQTFDSSFKIMLSDNTYELETILKEIDLRIIKFENQIPHLFLKHIVSEVYD